MQVSEVEVSIKLREIVQPRIKQKTGELKTKDSANDSMIVSVVNSDVHAIIFMIDPRKKYTLEYVQRELEYITHDCDILIVSNFTDLCNEKKPQISANDIKELIRKSGKNIRHCEASMSDRFGVKAIKTFISIPFTKLEEQFLLQQLERVKNDIQTSYQDFDKLSEEQDYSFYKDWLAKAIQDRLQKQQSGGSVRTAGTTQPAKPASNSPVKTTPQAPSSSTGNKPPAQGKPEEGGGFFSKLKSIVSSSEEQKPAPIVKKTDPRKAIHDLKQVAALAREGKQTDEVSIDAFDPSSLGGDDYDCFFSDDEDNAPAASGFIEESDEEDYNPLVTAGQDFEDDAIEYSVPAVAPTHKATATKKKNVPTKTTSEKKTQKASAPAPAPAPATRAVSTSEKKAQKASTPEKKSKKAPVPAPTPFSSDEDEAPNPLVTGGEDPFSSDDDAPNPLVAAGHDPFSDEDETPNPLVAAGEDPFGSDDDETPNPLVAAGEDPFGSDNDAPNPLVSAGEDPFGSDDETPNPLVAAGEDPFGSDDDETPNPLVAAGEDPFGSDDDAPNPLVSAGEDPFSSDDDAPNPLVATGEDPFSDDE